MNLVSEEVMNWMQYDFSMYFFQESETFKDLGMSDKFNLVVQVARQVQVSIEKCDSHVTEA